MTSDTSKIENTARIRELNDQLRTKGIGGQVVASGTLAYLDEGFRNRVLDAVRLTPVETGGGDDPYCEHDFGTVKVDGGSYTWKIDYYDAKMEFGSEDPSDPDRTTRVLTIMKSSDY